MYRSDIVRQFPEWPIEGESYWGWCRRRYLTHHVQKLLTLEECMLTATPEPSSLEEWLELSLPRLMLLKFTETWLLIDGLKLEEWLCRYVPANAVIEVGYYDYLENVYSKARLAFVLGHIPWRRKVNIFQKRPSQDWQFQYRVYRWSDVSVVSCRFVAAFFTMDFLCEECAGTLATGKFSLIFGQHLGTEIERRSLIVPHTQVIPNVIANIELYCRFCRVRPLYTIRRGRRLRNYVVY